MNWLEIKPTPYEQLPEEIFTQGRLGPIRISKEILHDWGWHVETGTTTLQRVIMHQQEELERQMLGLK